MDTVALLKDIKARNYKPVYFLHGDESYFIDLVSDAIENSVLEEAQRGFDQTILYGKETDLVSIVNAARRYPMMSDYQVIIVKEAQNLKWKDSDLLQRYLDAITPTTILVFAHKHGVLDKRTKLYKLIAQKGEVLESKKLYEDKVPMWITQQFQDDGRKIHPHAAALMAEFLGTDLSKVANEIDKLKLNIAKDVEIDAAAIERNIGISKDFNIFELNTALSKRDVVKCFQIVDYFAANPKSNPAPVLFGALGGHFIKILKYHYLPDKKSPEAAKALGVHPFFMRDYDIAARNYNRRKTFDVIHLIKDYDLKTKGVNAGPLVTAGDLMKELVYKILN